MTTPEDTLTEDLVAYWTATPPTGLSGWNIYHHHATAARSKPCLVIGHEGALRVPAMPDTRRVNLRVMVLSDMDTTGSDTHRDIAGIVDAAMSALGSPGPLTGTYLHAMLVETPDKALVAGTREEYTVLKRTAVVSRYTA